MEEERAVIPENPVPQEPQEQAVIMPPVSEKPAMKRKKIIVLCAAAIAVLAAVILLFRNGGTDAASKTQAQPTAISAKMKDDGTAYIPLYDGTSIIINEEVQSAILTKDRKHIVVHLKDGTLYITNKDQSEKNMIADNCQTFADIRDDGFFYLDEDDACYRVLFADYSAVLLDVNKGTVAQNNTTILCATDDGKIYTMAHNTAEKTKVGSSDDSIELEAISDDGQLSLWVTKAGSTLTLVLNDGENKTTLGEVDNKYNYTYATFSKDQKTLVITNSYSEKMWIKTVGADPVAVKLGATPMSSAIYTENGQLEDENSATITGLYISTKGDAGTNLYRISMNGDRERILSKVSDYKIANGHLFYTNEDSTLYCADLDGSEISNEVKISSDVKMFEITDNGKYIYFAKDYEDDVASLYCYKIGEEDPVRIASDVACFYSLGWGTLQTSYSTDGATVFFFKDAEDIDRTYSSFGTLMKWTYGNDSAEKIASEVVLFSISGALDSEEVDPASVMYMKYVDVDKDDNIFVNWMYFNGKESVKVASDVIK